jgi:type IV secretory pathway TraG/TraD family ATPase VirD4
VIEDDSRRGGGDRELRALAASAVMLVLVVGAAGMVMLAAAITTGLVSRRWAMPGLGSWVRGLSRVLSHPATPGRGLGPPYSAAVSMRPGLFWAVACVLGIGLFAGVGLVARCGWRWFGPTLPGHATRWEVEKNLSLGAARATARRTRPDLTPAQISAAPLEEIAVPLHRSAWGLPLGTQLNNPTGTLAPTQTGKTRGELVHMALAAPAALLCSTTKPDLFEFTALARARWAARTGAGPVMVLDATGSVSWPARVRFSFLQGCTTPEVAYQRAHTMVEAAAVGMETGVGNDKVFRERAKRVLQAYFLAAARAEHSVARIVDWAVARPPDLEPAEELKKDRGGVAYPQYAANLRREIEMVAETSDAVWMSVRRVLEPFLDPHLAHVFSPGPGEGLDVERFIAARGSLYVIAGENQAISMVPALTALVEHWLTTAQTMALKTTHRRLTPPASAILDELPNATPVPQLPDIISDSAGRGVLIHWAAQSLAQLEDIFTPTRSRQLIDNTTTLTVWGGLKDRRTLEWVSTLTGHYERRRYQTHHSGGMFNPGSSSVGSETVPTYRPGDVRRIPTGKVLILHRNLRAILARTVDVSQRPDSPQLEHDVTILRDGENLPITSAGYLHHHPDQPIPLHDPRPRRPRTGESCTAITEPLSSETPTDQTPILP